MLNPLTPIFEQAREWIIDPNAPGAVEAAHGNPLLLASRSRSRRRLRRRPLVFSREAPRVAEEL